MFRKRAFWLAMAFAAAALVTGVHAYAGKRPVPVDCRFVLCAYPDCLPNEHTEIPPGQCCPVCVPNK